MDSKVDSKVDTQPNDQDKQDKKNKYYVKIPKEQQRKRGVKKSNNPYEQIHILVKRVLKIVETIDMLIEKELPDETDE